MSSMTDHRARRVLGLPQGVWLNSGRIKSAWKAKAITTHPDRGGSAEAFIEASEAAKLLNKLNGVPSDSKPVRQPSPMLRLTGPSLPRRASRYRDPNYWQEQTYLESLYGRLGDYGRDGLLRAWYLMRGRK